MTLPAPGTLVKIRSTGELVCIVRIEGAPGATFAVIASLPGSSSRFAQRVVALHDLERVNEWAMNVA